MIISPSILNVEKEKYDEYIDELKKAGIEYIHLDIMDGKFVENKTEGVSMQEKIKKHSLIFDTHLMVEDPENYYRDFVKAGSNIITFHLEASKNPLKLIQKIHSMGAKCGISIKPATDVSKIVPYLSHLDLVLVMSVEPGRGGQKFMESSLEKIKYLRYLKEDQVNMKYLISVDGGINEETCKLVKSAGADMVVIGSALVKANDKKSFIEQVK